MNQAILGDAKVATEQPLRRGKKIKTGLIFALVCAAGAFALRSLSWKKSHGAGEERARPVAVKKVARESLSLQVAFDAELRPYQDVDLHAKVAGFVQEMRVDIGDRVAAGDLLATLEIPELKEEIDHALAAVKRNQDEVDRAQAAYEDAHLVFTRLTATDKEHPRLIAQQEIDAAKAKDRTAFAAVAAAKNQVLVSQADLKKLQRELEYSKITAPFSGVITKRHADPGDLVQGGVTPSSSALPLVRLSQIDTLRLAIPVSVSFVSKIQIGQPVEVRVESAGKTFAGKVSRFAREVDTATRTMETQVDVPNPDMQLIPGMYATATIKLEARDDALVVPIEAVSRKNSPAVLVVGKNNTLEERPIKIGLETPDKIEVLAGVREGELVVIGNRAELKAGQKVEPKPIANLE